MTIEDKDLAGSTESEVPEQAAAAPGADATADPVVAPATESPEEAAVPAAAEASATEDDSLEPAPASPASEAPPPEESAPEEPASALPAPEEPASEAPPPEESAPEEPASAVSAPEEPASAVSAPEEPASAETVAAATTEPVPVADAPAAEAATPAAAAEPTAAADSPDPAEAAPAATEERRPATAGDRPAITAPADIGDIADELSEEAFAEAVERTVFEFKEGDIVAGTVVRVDPDEALVDIGFKTEGVIPAKELSIRNNANPTDVVEVGDAIEALVLQMEDENGRLVLSKKRAQYERAWGRIETVMNEGGTVTGPVIEVVKGGLIVDIGLRGFLPASLVDLRRVRDLQPYVGEAIEAKVIELDKNRNNVVLSRRAYLEEAQAEQRQAFLDDLQPGDLREGVVSSVVNFGAFVDLGGMDGLVHVSELSWQHVSHPGEVVSVGDKVNVKVLEVDHDRERISLSIRQTREDPWEEFARTSQIGSIIDGAVTKTVPFGAFVSVGEGVEGLVHVSEIAMHHVESPELELSIGQAVKVKVTEIDPDRRRVSLSIKQARPDWQERAPQGESRREPRRPQRREFQREEEVPKETAFSADSSLEAILQELKEKGIGRG